MVRSREEPDDGAEGLGIEFEGFADGEEDTDEVLRNYLGDLESPQVAIPPVETIRNRLNVYGVNLAGSAKEETLSQLWFEMGGGILDLEDLALYSIEKKRENRPHAEVNILDLIEVGRKNSAYDIRRNLIESTADSLVQIGFPEKGVYQLFHMADEKKTRALTRLGWVLGQPFMKDFFEEIKNDRLLRGKELGYTDIMRLSLGELNSLVSIHSTKQYDQDITFEREDYQAELKILNDTINICKLAFFGFGKDK